MTVTTVLVLGWIMATTAAVSALGEPDISVETVMRDGLELPLKAWFPDGEGPWPVVLCRWYNTHPPGHLGESTFVANGYAFVVQAFRDGKGGDERGEPGTRFTRDDLDGYDTVEWIAAQPWCNGQVAMTGKSAGGITAFQAATAQPPHLKAIIPQNYGASFGTWGVWGYRASGAVTLAMTAHSRAIPDIQDPPWDTDRAAYKFLPLLELDLQGRGEVSPLWRQYVSQTRWTPDGGYRKVRCPVLLTGGWWDYYTGSALGLWAGLRESGATPEVRIIIDATQHVSQFPKDGRDYGDGRQSIAQASVRWLDHVLKGKKNGVEDEPPIKVFTMGANKWQRYDDWPPSGAVMTKAYLHNTGEGRFGTLGSALPGSEPPSEYVYDPDDPVPNLGGNHSVYFHHALVPVGSFDHSAHEQRPDVLVFSSDVLESDTEVTGPVAVRLWAATDAKDTDWTAILLDVEPDGTPYNVTMGIVRARYRHGIYEPPELLTPDKVEEYTLHLMPTSYTFKKGHRIRLYLSSSNFPLWDRNTNTGGDIATETRTQPARQRIYHDQQHPSHLLLPVVTGGIGGGAAE